MNKKPASKFCKKIYNVITAGNIITTPDNCGSVTNLWLSTISINKKVSMVQMVWISLNFFTLRKSSNPGMKIEFNFNIPN